MIGCTYVRSGSPHSLAVSIYPGPCSWQTPWGMTSCGSAAPNRDPCPIEETADSEMVWLGESGGLSQPVGGSIEARPMASKLPYIPAFSACGHMGKAKKTEDFRRSRIPPRRAHGTLQPFGMKVL